MLWIEAMEKVDQAALGVGLKDEHGGLLSAEEALAIMVPWSGWDDLEAEVKNGTATPEAFVFWALPYIDKFRRVRMRKKTERILNSIQQKIQNTESLQK